MTLEGRSILVTGASQGIGRGCAIQLAQAGANVGINYRSHPEAAEEVAAEVRAIGRKAVLLPCDVSDAAAVEKMFKDFVGDLGPLNGAVSNAAYSDREAMVTADMAGFERTINVTMWGAFHCVRTAAQTMIKQGNGGSIVVIGSPHAVIPVPSSMAYNMAKAAIDHMTRTAAIELAPERIRVNVVHPGWIDTPGERKFFSEEELAEGAKSIPWGRLGQPEEIGRLVTFVMGDACDYMTGSTLLMDGGISLAFGSDRD